MVWALFVAGPRYLASCCWLNHAPVVVFVLDQPEVEFLKHTTGSTVVHIDQGRNILL